MGIKNLINVNELKLAKTYINNIKISSPPQFLLDLINELSLKNPDIKSVIDGINKDINLASKVIKAVNSPIYGLSAKVISIEHGFSLLGQDKFKNIILNPAYNLALKQSIGGFDGAWKHAHFIGQISEIIASHIQTQLFGQFYLAGLFHDVGGLVLTLNSKNYIKIEDQNILHPITMPLWEKEQYHVTHASISVLLAKSWGLPDTICNAIYLHHHLYATYRKEVSSESITMAAVIQLADYYNCKRLAVADIKTSVEYGLIYTNAVEELMLTEYDLIQIESEVKSLTEKSDN